MNRYVEAARPRTLPAAVAPVLVGTAAAVRFSAWRALAALGVALAVQVAVNYANDYSDGMRGVDTAARVGPRRAVASGLIAPAAMKVAIGCALLVAAAFGVALAAVTTWLLLLVGLVCFLAALGYSGGPRPYASLGLGEVFVFVFFGLVATVGSQFVQDEAIGRLAVIAAFPVGFLAVAILVVNNLRDIPTDTQAGKRTLAVRLGDGWTRQLYLGLMLAPFLFVGVLALAARSAWPLLALVALPLVVGPTTLVRNGAAGPELIAVLGQTARVQLVFAVLLALGLALS